MPYKGPFVITQCWANDTITLQYGAIKISHNIRRIKPYKYDKKLKILTLKICMTM